MLKTILAVAALIVAPTVGNSKGAESVRYPTVGNPALVISVPDGWTRKLSTSGIQPQPFLLTSAHHVEVATIILANLATPEAFARTISAFSHLQMRNAAPTQLLGFPAYMFDASFTDVAGTLINMHVIQAKLDKSHMALIEIRSPSKGPNARELAEGKHILETLKFASILQ